MRRRLTITVISLVAGALLVAGLGTWLLERRGAREETRRALGQQAEALAAVAEEATRARLVNDLRRALRLDGAALVRLDRGGRPLDPLPGGLVLGENELARLAAGATVSGSAGDTAYAAAAFRRRAAPGAVVLTRGHSSGARGAAPFFLVSAAATIIVAAVMADRLGRRFAHPLADAIGAAGRIAAGDLGARAETVTGADPELAALTGSINAMAATLERAKGLERQFLLSVSHELRTPLTSVRGFAEAIADGTATDTARAAQVIEAEARRLERLVGDLLELAKLDARSFSLDIGPVDTLAVVADTVAGFGPAARAAGLRIEMAPGLPATAMATADPVRLAQVVANLVENALKFATSRIAVAIGTTAGAVIVAVSDDGPGIDGEELGQIFDRLFQSTRRPARQVGSGLGLAIVSELAAAMGGRVDVDSQPGATRLVVTLRAWP